MKQFTSVNDVENIQELISLAAKMKKNPLAFNHVGQGKTMVLLFFNPSLRTRLSTQKAGQNLGFSVITMDAASGWKLEIEEGVIMNTDKAEHIKEAAAVISSYADIIGIRSFPTLSDKDKDDQDLILNTFIQYASVPIISLESAIRHPLQSLADLLTIEEHKKSKRPKIVLSWAPHPKALPQAVANSFSEWVLQTDSEFVITHPPGYELNEQFTSGASIEYDQEKAFEGADFIYTKNWSSYHHYGKILPVEKDWMITTKKMESTNQGHFMHCLPVRRNVVVEDAVIDLPNALHLEQANNRTFAAQAIIHQLLINQ